MKYLFIFLFFTTTNQVCAQKYQPLVEEGKYWIYEHYGTGDNPCDYRWTNNAEIHHFGIDTLISDTFYKKVLISRLKLVTSMGPVVRPYEITSTNVMGFIREDTLTKKVYLIPNGYFYNPCKEEIKENLFFDFSLEQGDTLNECLRNSIERFGNPDVPFYPVVDSVKYEIGQYGIKRKHFYSFGYFDQCNFWHVPGYIMEGFGFIDGPFRGPINRQLINYCEGTLVDCNIISSTKDITTNSNQIKIHPNPSYAGDIIIDIPDYDDNHEYRYSVQSASGVIVNKGILSQKVNDLSLDVSSGVYFVSLIQEGKLINTQKWIVIR